VSFSRPVSSSGSFSCTRTGTLAGTSVARSTSAGSPFAADRRLADGVASRTSPLPSYATSTPW
jgi:hypothetical protein